MNTVQKLLTRDTKKTQAKMMIIKTCEKGQRITNKQQKHYAYT